MTPFCGVSPRCDCPISLNLCGGSSRSEAAGREEINAAFLETSELPPKQHLSPREIKFMGSFCRSIC